MRRQIQSFLFGFIILGSLFFSIFSNASIPPYVDLSATVVFDGTNFENTSYIPDSSPAINAGNDSAPTNGIVKVGDKVKYNSSINQNNADGSNVRATYTLTNATWDILPSRCLTASTSPAVTSNISEISSDGRTLICNFGNFTQGTTATIELVATADLVPNNTTMTLSATAQSDNAPSTSVDNINTVITAASKLDIYSYSDRVETTPGNYNYSDSKDSYICHTPGTNSYTANVNGGCMGADILGTVFKYKFAVALDLGSNFTLNDPLNFTTSATFSYLAGMTGSFAGELLNCSVLHGSSSINCNNVVIDSVNNQINYDINLNGIVNADLDTENRYATYQINFFAPQTNIPFIPSALVTSNLIKSTSFDPNDAMAVSNYNASTEYLETCPSPTDPGYINDIRSDYCNNRWDISDSKVGPGGNIYGGRFYDSPFNYTPVGEQWDSISTRSTRIHGVGYPGSDINLTMGMNLSNQLGFSKDNTYITCAKRPQDSGGNPLAYFSGEMGDFDTDTNLSYVLARGVFVGPLSYSRNALGLDGVTNTSLGITSGIQDMQPMNFDGSVFKLQFSTAPLSNPRTDNCADALGWVDWTGPGSVSGALGGNTNAITRFRVVVDLKANIFQELIGKREQIYAYPKLQITSNTTVLNNWKTTNAIVTNNVLPIYFSDFDSSATRFCPANWCSAPTTNNTFSTSTQQTSFNVDYHRSLVEIQDSLIKISKSVDKETTEDEFDTLTYTIIPEYLGSGTTDNVTLNDVLGNSTGAAIFDTSSLQFICPATCTSVSPIITWSNNNTTLNIVWNGFVVGDNLPQIQISARLQAFVTNGIIPNNVTLNAPLSANKNVSAQAVTNLVTSTSFSIDKTVQKTVYPVNNQFDYTLNLSYPAGSAVGVSEFIDVIPYNGDDLDNTSRYGIPTDYNGSVSFVSLTDVYGVVVNSSSKLFTNSNPALINVDPKCSSNDIGSPGVWDVDGTLNISASNQQGNDWALYCNSIDTPTVWCTEAQFGTFGCPMGFNDITAFRFQTNNEPRASLGVPAPYDVAVRFPIIVTLFAEDNVSENVYTNNFSGRISSVPQTLIIDGQSLTTMSSPLPIISNDVTVTVVSGSIGDRVWYDLNADGVQDPDEGGIPGTVVDLIWYGPDNVLGGGDDMTWSTTTDGNGNYLFNDLPSGNFVVTVNPPANLVQSYDYDGVISTDTSTRTLTPIFDGNGVLTDIEDSRDQDFGYHGDAKLSGTLWEDVNIDVNIDPTETHFFSGIIVELLDANGNVIATTTTDANGYYQFTNLMPGSYKVVSKAPNNYSQTFDVDGKDTANIYSITIGYGENVINQNFGYLVYGKDLINTGKELGIITIVGIVILVLLSFLSRKKYSNLI